MKKRRFAAARVLRLYLRSIVALALTAGTLAAQLEGANRAWFHIEPLIGGGLWLELDLETRKLRWGKGDFPAVPASIGSLFPTKGVGLVDASGKVRVHLVTVKLGALTEAEVQALMANEYHLVLSTLNFEWYWEFVSTRQSDLPPYIAGPAHSLRLENVGYPKQKDTDPFLWDSTGSSTHGPTIGPQGVPFGVKINCHGAPDNGLFVDMSALAAPRSSRRHPTRSSSGSTMAFSPPPALSGSTGSC